MKKVNKDPFTSLKKLRTVYNTFSTGSSVRTKFIWRVLKRNELAVRAASKTTIFCGKKQEWNENDAALIIKTLHERSDERVCVCRPNGEGSEPLFTRSMSNDRRNIHFGNRWLSTVTCRQLNGMTLIELKHPKSAMRGIKLLFWKPLLCQTCLTTVLLLLTKTASSTEPELLRTGSERTVYRDTCA